LPAVVVAATDCSGHAWQIVAVHRRPCHPAAAQAFAVPLPSPSHRRASFRCRAIDTTADDAPHANMVTRAPSPLVQNHVKNDEDMENISAKKYLRTARISVH